MEVFSLFLHQKDESVDKTNSSFLFVPKFYRNSNEELYQQILEIVTGLYEKFVSKNVKKRKNKEKAKMSDAEIISIQLLIECLDKTQNSGYVYLHTNYPNLVNYEGHSRFKF